MVTAITAHARRDHPRECCGILLGVDNTLIEAAAAENVAGDPLRHYEVSPADHIAQIRRCRSMANAGGMRLAILGVYHSHPHSAAVPSPTDLDQAWEEYVYLIAGPVGRSAPMEVRAYRLKAGRFIDVQLTPAPAGDSD